MATVLCILPKSSVLLCVLWAKRLGAKDIRKDIFLFTVGSVCRVKRFTAGSRNSQGRWKVRDDETEVRKWLGQQSENFCAAGFEALVKRWDKCISVGGGYVEK
jgi:hypothetical protein